MHGGYQIVITFFSARIMVEEDKGTSDCQNFPLVLAISFLSTGVAYGDAKLIEFCMLFQSTFAPHFHWCFVIAVATSPVLQRYDIMLDSWSGTLSPVLPDLLGPQSPLYYALMT